MLENKRAETLRLLRESGENVSGQDLCEHFGISRTAVWKIMNQLKEEGYEIEAVQNKGYRLLNEPDLMTKDELESRTHTKYVGQTVYYSHEVDSTNTWAKRLAEEGAPNGTLTTAETQTAGKGRRGRVWKSPEGTSVSMSLLLYPDLEPAKAPMLTIVMGLAVVQGVQRALGVDTRIKWPNDAVLNGKKLCGILTEMSAQIDNINYVVIGTGINVGGVFADIPFCFRSYSSSNMHARRKIRVRKNILSHSSGYRWLLAHNPPITPKVTSAITRSDMTR